MKRILFATGNAHKLGEIKAILSDIGLDVVSMGEAGVDAEIVEDGKSFEENALIKARAVSKASGEPALADDSGLVVDALCGEPGIYSSRWMGEDTSYHVKNTEILRRLEGLPDEKRTARFVCVCACVFPDGRDTEGSKRVRMASSSSEKSRKSSACRSSRFPVDWTLCIFFFSSRPPWGSCRVRLFCSCSTRW